MMGRANDANQGIQVNNGNFQATNVAIGKKASAHSENQLRFLVPVAELKDFLKGVELSDRDRALAMAAIAVIEDEVQKPAPEVGQIQSALDRLAQLGATSTALFPLIDRLTPLLQRIGQSMLG